MSAGERTEAATPRRLEELRSQGRVIRSVDLVTAVSLLASLVLLQSLGGESVGRMRGFMTQTLANLARPELNETNVGELAFSSGSLFLGAITPLLLALMVVGLVVSVVQVGFHVNAQAVTPNFSHINPLSGMQRLISPRSMVELAKALVKVTIVSFAIWKVYSDNLMAFLALGGNDVRAAMPSLIDLTMKLGMTASCALLVLGVLDYAYQRWDFQRGARMSKDEVREEYKQQEGDPQVRGRIRQLQRKLATGRMMSQVPKADVVVTNPTHLAVALSYRSGDMGAPKVVAKGADLVAARIREIARDNNVPVVENKPLARALYGAVEVDQEIPAELFQAVAEVLAYIYSLRGYTPREGD